MGQKEALSICSEAERHAPSSMTSLGKNLKVLLIQPPEVGGVKTLLPHFDRGMKDVGFKPPLGLLCVATAIDTLSSHKVKVIDAVAQKMNFEALIREVIQYQPDVVGISAWTDFWWPAYKTGELIKQALPNVHLCYGGPHVSIYPQETLSVDFADSVIVGDGEIPFLFLCNMVSHGDLSNDFPGLHLKLGGVKSPPMLQFIQADLDALPIPDRSLLLSSHYGSVLSKGNLTTTMITSRGCPHRCSFCKLNFQKTIARSAQSIVDEFKEIKTLGISEVEIYDDTFTWGQERLRDICEGLIRDGNDVTWAVRDRVSAADPEMYALMYKAGCRRIHLGIESGVQRVLDRMQKRITTDQALFAVATAKKAGFEVLTYFMFGNLDETVSDMKETIAFALKLNSDYAEFSITIPYPGTQMYEEALATRIIPHDFWLDYTKHPMPDMKIPHVIENYADLKTLQNLLNMAIRKFYFRPRYMVRELMRLRSAGEFIRKARMGRHLARSVYVK